MCQVRGCVPHHLLAFERVQDGQVSGVLQGEDDDFPGVVEPGRSSNNQPTAPS